MATDRRRALFVVLLALLAIMAGSCSSSKSPAGPSGPNGGGSGGGPSGIPPWPSPEPGIPPPGLENYTSADGLVKIYVIGFNPTRNSQIFAGGRAEIYFQVIYSQEGRGRATVMPFIVDDPLENPGKEGRVSRVFAGTGLMPGSNIYWIAGTFLVPTAETIPYLRFCGYYDNRISWCNIHLEVGWHP